MRFEASLKVCRGSKHAEDAKFLTSGNPFKSCEREPAARPQSKPNADARSPAEGFRVYILKYSTVDSRQVPNSQVLRDGKAGLCMIGT